jgi:hypothetical protein
MEKRTSNTTDTNLVEELKPENIKIKVVNSKSKTILPKGSLNG